MDRLTIRNNDGTADPILDGDGLMVESLMRWAGAAQDRLAAYEDTGLTPEQVAEMQKNFEHLAAMGRVVALYLDEFCDRSLPYGEMFADASRKARREIDALRSDRDHWRRRAEAAKKDLNELRKRTGWNCAYCECDTNYVREVCAGCGYNNYNNWVWRGPRDESKEVPRD